MKKHLTLSFSLFFVFLLVFSGCRMRYATVNTIQPAQITFPPNIQKILIVNRTQFKKNTVLNVVEGVLTGEMPGEDKANVQALITSLQQTLALSPRFTSQQATEVLVGNSLTQAFPDPISWSKIDSLCSTYQADAVVAIEVFDTDFIVTNGKRVVKQKVDQGGVKKEVDVDEYYAEGIGKIKAGFKLYDPKARVIVDQQLFTQSKRWESKGKNATDAAINLIVKSEATKFVSKMMGESYAYKIAPMPVTLSRAFYKKGRIPQIAMGRRMAEVKDWLGAIEMWEGSLAKVGNKDGGKLCYNIAVAYEAIGDLENAKKWIAKSYVSYGNKKAKAYSLLIDRRIQDAKILEGQMN